MQSKFVAVNDYLKKNLQFLFGFLIINLSSFSQSPGSNKMLFIIDSIPLITDPEGWNQILEEDIADYSVITRTDSLKLLGWEQVAAITYIFTKEYRNRHDSIKKIPSLKQMVMNVDRLYLNGSPYTGRYIDYYNNGKIQNEGMLLNGKINGELVVYYKTGIKKSITNYKEGIRHGFWKDYYQNGALRRENEYIMGKGNRTGKSYFINGQIMHEIKLKNTTGYDTSITYYSNGKVKKIKMTKTGEFHPTKKEADMNYHSTMFYEHIRTGDIKAARKNFYQIWESDNASIDTWFKEGFLLTSEFRFNEAIDRFDKALAIEPLMKEALEQRGLARIKRYKFSYDRTSFKNREDVPLVLEDLILLSEDERAKVCTDLLLADDLDPGVNYNNKPVPDVLLQYCKKKKTN